MSSSCPIEVASAADALNIAALDRMAWPVAPDTFIPDGEHIWRVWCSYASVWVARSAARLPATGDVAGAVVLFPTRQRELFLHKVMVHPDCRGQGLGTALMQAAVDSAADPVLLTVDPANAGALAVYRKLGFTVRETISGYYRPHEDRHIMCHPGSAG